MIDTTILFFAILSLLSLVGAVVVGGSVIGGRLSSALASGRRTLARDFGEYALPLAAMVATTSTLGSLFLSEVADYDPCVLCWVQRAFMYPLAVVLIVASVRRRADIWKYALPWSLVGGLVSLFHYAEQQQWIGGSEGLCDAANPCTFIWVWEFGFVSIPFMALTGFLFVAALMGLQAVRSASSSDEMIRS